MRFGDKTRRAVVAEHTVLPDHPYPHPHPRVPRPSQNDFLLKPVYDRGPPRNGLDKVADKHGYQYEDGFPVKTNHVHTDRIPNGFDNHRVMEKQSVLYEDGFPVQQTSHRHGNGFDSRSSEKQNYENGFPVKTNHKHPNHANGFDSMSSEKQNYTYENGFPVKTNHKHPNHANGFDNRSSDKQNYTYENGFPVNTNHANGFDSRSSDKQNYTYEDSFPVKTNHANGFDSRSSDKQNYTYEDGFPVKTNHKHPNHANGFDSRPPLNKHSYAYEDGFPIKNNHKHMNRISNSYENILETQRQPLIYEDGFPVRPNHVLASRGPEKSQENLYENGFPLRTNSHEDRPRRYNQQQLQQLQQQCYVNVNLSQQPPVSYSHRKQPLLMVKPIVRQEGTAADEKGAGQDRLGIYIKSVVKGGAADADGQLQAGDQLLKVDGQSLVGITQERAAEYLVRTGPTVTLEVAKQGAIYHGLATLLQQPSPVMARGPRRMSERDLPSRVLSEQNHNGDPRRSLNTHAPIQSSKSVPALNSGNNDLVHGGPVSSTPATHPSAKHEVFNPGYSRTSSTNSIPQQSQAQQGLRSKSSQNLSDPRSPNPQLPPTGLGSRQSSNPSLHHPHLPPHPQSSQHAGHSGGQVGSGQQSNGEGERFYQNLSIYRNQEIHNGYPPPSPNRGKLPSPQQAHDDRSPATAQVKGLRGSQSSLHNPTSAPSLRPASAYLPPSNPSGGYNGPQQMAARSQSSRDIGQESPQGYSPQQVASRSQSSRDIMRQEAKLHEMQEEVRRREMRGVVSPQQYSVQPGPPHTRPQMAAHLQQRVPNTTYPYPQESNHPYPGPSPQYNGGQRPPSSYAPPTAPKPVRHPSEPALNRPPNMYEQYRPHPHPEQQYRPQTGPLLLAQGEQYRPHPGPQGENRVGFSPQYVGDGPSRPQYAADSPSRPQYTTDSPNRPPYATEGPNRPQYAMDGQNRPQYATDSPGRPQMPHEEAGYRDSPPPPPPPTTTHPLYQQKAATSTGQQADARYTASSGDAPRGGFYPASPSSGGPPRHPFPFNSVATNPWDREEREKDQQRRREAARAWRDQQINELSSLAQRTPQQEEQLRALRLEREFQRRAEEAAKLEEEEEAEEEQESVERVQGLLRMATATQNTPPKHPQPPRPPPTEDKERIRREQEMKREQEANKRREEENRQQQLQQQQQQMLQQQQQMLQQQQQQQQQQQMLQQQQQQQHQLKENFMASPTQPTTSQSSAPTRPPTNININKATNPSHLRLDNLVINGPSSPTAQYNGYNGSYQTTHGEGILKSPPQSPTESGTARLDTLLGTPQPPAPPERGSSFAITQAVTQGVLRNAGRESSGIGTATVKRVSFSDPNANNTSSSQPMERIREDPNHFINEAETLLASPKSPDGGPFGSNTPGVIGSQEVYKDPRARLLAAQQKLQTTRSGPLPEKLSFKEKMKMFAMETGEDGTPRDKVKISRAQRDIDNLGSTPTSPLSPSNNNNQ